jgi:hypothetical protein
MVIRVGTRVGDCSGAVASNAVVSVSSGDKSDPPQQVGVALVHAKGVELRGHF